MAALVKKTSAVKYSSYAGNVKTFKTPQKNTRKSLIKTKNAQKQQHQTENMKNLVKETFGENGKCSICKLSDIDDLNYGAIHGRKEFAVHLFCLVRFSFTNRVHHKFAQLNRTQTSFNLSTFQQIYPNKEPMLLALLVFYYKTYGI